MGVLSFIRKGLPYRVGGMQCFRAGAILTACFLAGCAQSPHDLVARGETAQLEAMIADAPERTHETNVLGKTPLHYAVTAGRVEAMDLLVRKGADIEAKDRTGMTPLHVAAMMGRVEEAKWLIEHGAVLEVQDSFGDTPLHTAALFGQGRMVQLLTDSGANVSVKNLEGKTPAQLAGENGLTKISHYLEQRQSPRPDA